jgi:hypothetical protein
MRSTNIMRIRLIQDGLFFIGLALLVTACFNEPDFGETPAIEFISITKETFEASGGIGNSRRDSVIIALKFQDKSGDLGEDISGGADTNRLRTKFATQTWGNYEVRTFRLNKGKYEEINQDVNNKLFFPRLYKPNQKGALEGTLYFRQIFFYNPKYGRYPVKFQVRIRDRDFNASNVIETDTITVPLPN